MGGRGKQVSVLVSWPCFMGSPIVVFYKLNSNPFSPSAPLTLLGHFLPYPLSPPDHTCQAHLSVPPTTLTHAPLPSLKCSQAQQNGHSAYVWQVHLCLPAPWEPAAGTTGMECACMKDSSQGKPTPVLKIQRIIKYLEI